MAERPFSSILKRLTCQSINTPTEKAANVGDKTRDARQWSQWAWHQETQWGYKEEWGTEGFKGNVQITEIAIHLK